MIPTIFSVTGHRDIHENAIPHIKEILKDTFNSFKENYSHTPAILISALAEGADMLVAEVALECGVELHVMLPYQEDAYLKSFDNTQNIQKFKDLISQASRVEVIADINHHTATESYELLGKKLADLSTILIALWDGKDTGKKGGTSEVIKYKMSQKGKIRERHRGSAVYIIYTPRDEGDFVPEKIVLEKKYIGHYIKEKDFENFMINIDTLNREIEEKKESGGTYLQNMMKFFERKASTNQRKFKLYSKLILMISGLSIVSLEFYHDFGKDAGLMLYGAGLLVAFLTYFVFMKKGAVQNNFVYSRGFAEALRIQNAWNASNIDASVADRYLTDQHHKYTWIRIALKNMTYMDNRPFVPTYDKGSRPEDWINGQIDYYKSAIKDRERRYRFWTTLEKIFYSMGLVFIILIFVFYFSKNLLIPHHDHHLGHLLLHILIFISGISLLIAAFIGEKYNQIEGFKEEIYNFGLMHSLFDDTKEALRNVKKGSDDYKGLIYELGLEALEENEKWVVLHDKNRAKPIIE